MNPSTRTQPRAHAHHPRQQSMMCCTWSTSCACPQFHERNLDADLALALCLDLQVQRGGPTRFLIH
jgi:hypothetical protein